MNRSPALALLLLLLTPPAFAAQPDGTLVDRRECAPLQPYEDLAVLARAMRRAPPDEVRYRRLERAAVCERLVYLSDGLRIVAVMIRPRRAEGRRLPVIIYNHGSSAAEGALPERVHPFQAEWAAEGYIFLASQYRGGGGSEGRDEGGGADVHDVLNLRPLLRSISFADTANVFMWGHSRGGAMTYLAIAAGMPVRAAAVTAGVADYTRRRGTLSDSARVARSALAWPERLGVPLLLMHGDSDAVVDPEQSRRLASALDSLGRPVELVVFAGGDHNLTRHQEQVFRRILAWVRRHRAR